MQDYTLENLLDRRFKFTDPDRFLKFARDIFISALTASFKDEKHQPSQRALVLHFCHAVEDLRTIKFSDIDNQCSCELVTMVGNRHDYDNQRDFSRNLWKIHGAELREIANKKHAVVVEVVQFFIDSGCFEPNDSRISSIYATCAVDGARQMNRDVIDAILAQENFQANPVETMKFLLHAGETAHSRGGFSLAVSRGEEHPMNAILDDYVMKPYGLEFTVQHNRHGCRDEVADLDEYFLFNPKGEYGLPRLSFFTGSDIAGGAQYAASYMESVTLPKITSPHDVLNDVSKHRYSLSQLLNNSDLGEAAKALVQQALRPDTVKPAQMRPSAMGS